MFALSLLLGAAATLATEVSDPFLLDGRATPDHVLESREQAIMKTLYTSNNKKYYAAGGGNNNNNNNDNMNDNMNDDKNEESMEEYYDRQYWSVKLVYSHESCGGQYLVGVRNELIGDNEENCIKQLGDVEYAPDEDGSGSYAYTQCVEVNEKNNYDVYEVRECRKGLTRTPAGVRAVRADLYYQECEDENLRVVIFVAEGCNGVGFDDSGQYHNFQCGPASEFQAAQDNNDNMNQNNQKQEEIDFVLTTCGHESCTENYQGNYQGNNNNNDNMNNNNKNNGCKSVTYKTGECYYENDYGGYKHKIYSCWDETDEDWVLEAASLVVPVEEEAGSSAGVIAATTITALATVAIGGFFLYKRNKAAQDGNEALLGPNENINSGQARSNV